MVKHIQNKLVVLGQINEVKKFISYFQLDNEMFENCFDFNKIIPMPQELADMDENSPYDRVMKYALYKSDNYTFYCYKTDYELVMRDIKNDVSMGKLYDKYAMQSISNLYKYGYISKCQWARDNWGTERNSYDTYVSKDIINENNDKEEITLMFLTSNNSVEIIINKLIEMYPNLDFQYYYANENVGYDVGRGTKINGVLDMEYLQDDSKDAWDLALKLWDREYEFEWTESDGYVYK